MKAGFEKFYTENGRYPDADEIDGYDYLPSSRTIQRAHGGLKQLRSTLGQPLLHAGEYRSRIQKQSGIRGKELEWKVYQQLAAYFGEEFVHRESPLDERGWLRFDYVIYTREGKCGIDIFFAETLTIAQNTIVLKLRQHDNYERVDFPVYLVAISDDRIRQEEIDKIVQNKKKPMPGNVRATTLATFLEMIQGRQRLRVVP
jgi:hypothetical protein